MSTSENFACLNVVCGNQLVRAGGRRIYIRLATIGRTPLPTTASKHQTLDRLMERDNRGNAGAQRDHPGKPSSTPYSHPPPQERRRSTRATRSRSTPQNLARPDVLVTPDPLAQPTPPFSPTSNPPAHQRIPQLPYVSTRTRDFIPTEPVPFSVNGAPGISVSQAIAGEYEGLAGRDDRISSFKSSKAICRIRVGTTMLQETSLC